MTSFGPPACGHERRFLEHIRFLRNPDVLSIHVLAHVLVGEPGATSPGRALMPMSLPTGVIVLTEQDHGAAIGFVWIADPDRLDRLERLDRARPTSWRAHRCGWVLHLHGSGFRRWVGRIRTTNGLRIFAGIPVGITFSTTLESATYRFVVVLAPIETNKPSNLTLISTYRLRFGEKTKRNKKRKRQNHQ